MNDKKRRHRDFIQNLSIALLAVTAALLFANMYHLGGAAGGWQLLSSPGTQAPANSTGQITPLSAPVQTVVTGPYGRFGSVTLTTADEDFSPLRSLLEQALGSARTGTPCGTEEFLEALKNTSVYCDFLSPLPLTVLADLVWTSGGDETVYARRLAVAERGDRVVLYLWDGDETCLRCDTALTSEDLSDTVSQYELGNAQLALDAAITQYPSLDPCSLFLEEEPALPTLSAALPLSDTGRLLTVMGFNPNTQNRYPDASGTQVIMENGRTLRIYADDTVTYLSGGDDVLSVSADGELPTLLEASLGCGSLLNTLLTSAGGDTAVWLMDVRRSGTSTTLCFGYQVGGVPIRFSDGEPAAEITLSGTAVSSMTLRIRQYTALEETSLLLPLRQALAVAARHPGTELTIGYVDNGSDTVSAQWLAE